MGQEGQITTAIHKPECISDKDFENIPANSLSGWEMNAEAQNKKPGFITNPGLYKKFFGNVLLSHSASQAVPSAQKSLTSVFGMGTGVTSLPLPPKKNYL